MGIDKDRVKAVLDYWFQGDMEDIKKYKWFPALHHRHSVDTEIHDMFKEDIIQAFNLPSPLPSDIMECMAYILLLDQYNRHYCRYLFSLERINEEAYEEQKGMGSALAREVSGHIIDQGLGEYLSIPMKIFLWMPFRHSNDKAVVGKVIDALPKLQERHEKEALLWKQFHKVSFTKYLHFNEGKKGEVGTYRDVDILERMEGIGVEEEMVQHKLYKCIVKYMKGKNMEQYPSVAVSLSGGVDSMVLTRILALYTAREGIPTKVIGVHINYGNRPESGDEARYVKRWCEKYGIEYYERKVEDYRRGVTPRDEYENKVREIRFQTYEHVLAEEGAPAILFGHHLDDERENVICNLMKGKNTFALAGMSDTSRLFNVDVWRPMMAVGKDVIYDFAHLHGVSYFLDTTPKWSNRGKLRGQLIPLLVDIFGEGVSSNLTTFSNNLKSLTDVIEQQFILPTLANVVEGKLGFYVNIEEIKALPIGCWQEITNRMMLQHKLPIIPKPGLQQVLKMVRAAHPKPYSWISVRKGIHIMYDHDTLFVWYPKVMAGPYIPSSPLPYPHHHSYGPWRVSISGVEEVAWEKESVSIEELMVGKWVQRVPVEVGSVLDAGVYYKPHCVFRHLNAELKKCLPSVSSSCKGTGSQSVTVSFEWENAL